jgi:hypothetical protein
VQTFTPVFTGFSTQPAGDFSYIDFGAYVLLWSSTTGPGTSNATTMTINNLPAAIRPTGLRTVNTNMMDNGIGQAAGYVIIDFLGNITFARYQVSGGFVTGGGAFTASGSKDWPAGNIVVYPK